MRYVPLISSFLFPQIFSCFNRSSSAFSCIDLFRTFFFQSRIFPGVALSAVLTLANASKEYNLAEFIEIMQVCCIYPFINLTALFLPVNWRVKCVLGADYMEKFQPGLGFPP